MVYRFSSPDLLHKFNVLNSDFHQTIRSLIHRVAQNAVFQIFLHFGDVYHAALRKLLELRIVDICAVHSHNVAFAQSIWFEHERVICCC